MTEKTGPAWGYKMVKGEIVSKLFEDGLPARGWADSPANCKPPKKAKD